MEGQSTTPQLSSNPVVNQIIPGTNISVNKKIGDVTINSSGGGGGGTQTIVKYATFVGGTALSIASQNIYSTTITTTAPSRIVATCTFMINNQGAAGQLMYAAVVIGGVVCSPEFTYVHPKDDSGTTFTIQGSGIAGTTGTFNVIIQAYGSTSLFTADANMVVYTNVING